MELLGGHELQLDRGGSPEPSSAGARRGKAVKDTSNTNKVFNLTVAIDCLTVPRQRLGPRTSLNYFSVGGALT